MTIFAIATRPQAKCTARADCYLVSVKNESYAAMFGGGVAGNLSYTAWAPESRGLTHGQTPWINDAAFRASETEFLAAVVNPSRDDR